MRGQSDMLQMWTAELDAMTDAGAASSSPITRSSPVPPARVQALEHLVLHAAEHPDIWVTTLADVAAHTATTPGLHPRRITRPECD